MFTVTQRSQPDGGDPNAGPAIPDPFEALGMGPDLYDYRGPYRQYLAPSPVTTTAAATTAAPPPPPPLAEPAFREQCARAARAIKGANFLLIGAGAGLGVDSGLAAYADVAAVPVSPRYPPEPVQLLYASSTSLLLSLSPSLSLFLSLSLSPPPSFPKLAS